MKKIYALAIALFAICFTVQKTNAQCAAAFSYTASGDTATFTDLSTASGTIVSWNWSFGDGNFSTTQNPTHVYTACGVYNVSLTIFTSAFCSNTFNSSVTVNGGINASYTYTVDTTTGTVSFQAQPLGFNLLYAWDFGDGSVDSTVAPNHTYPTGDYYVCLTVYDDAGICSNTYCDSVSVYVAPPTCTTTFTYTDNGGGNIMFQASPFSFGMTYTWDFGDGNTGTNGIAFNTYATNGTYTVCLTAVDSATMCTSNFCDTITLTPDTTNCNVNFSYFDNNGQVSFVANSASFSNSYSWDFGDGNTGTGAGVSNTYAASGTYYVCLTTSNSFDACTATSCDSVDVVITGINELTSANFQLNAFPNPVNDETTISYTLSSSSEVKLTLTDILGKTISELENSQQPKGIYSVKWNAGMVENGIYLITLNVDGRMVTKKLVVAK